jgi:hypothetical protein
MVKIHMLMSAMRTKGYDRFGGFVDYQGEGSPTFNEH